MNNADTTKEQTDIILLKETTVTRVAGDKIGCSNIFEGPEGLVATLSVFSTDEDIKVHKGDKIEINNSFFVVSSIILAEGEKGNGIVELKPNQDEQLN